MNLRSPISHQTKAGNRGRLSGTNPTIVAPASCCLLRNQKRGQARRRRVEGIHPRSQSVSDLSQTDRNILLRQKGLAEAQRGNYGEAIAIFTQLIEFNPNSATDYNNRGLVYFQSKQMDAALADYNHALALNPRLDSAYNNRANYYAAQGELLEAILDYDSALDLNPGNVRAWINQGITFRDLQLYEQAIECFELALCMGQLEGHIYAERGRTYHLWGDWNCAIADYKRALFHLPMTSSPRELTTRLRIQISSWLDTLLNPWHS